MFWIANSIFFKFKIYNTRIEYQNHLIGWTPSPNKTWLNESWQLESEITWLAEFPDPENLSGREQKSETMIGWIPSQKNLVGRGLDDKIIWLAKLRPQQIWLDEIQIGKTSDWPLMFFWPLTHTYELLFFFSYDPSYSRGNKYFQNQSYFEYKYSYSLSTNLFLIQIGFLFIIYIQRWIKDETT
jgi:hypothetical protein